MKLIIIDDNSQFRSDLKFYLEEHLKMEVIGEASSGEEFLTMETIHKADVILMDIVMKQLDGIETTKEILRKMSHLKIIAITMHIEQIFHAELIKIGFMGCVYKSDVFENIENAIQEVYQGHLFFPTKLKM
ncbi:MAG: response regulator transcription factor [Salinivirgaceae bacterium]